MQTRSEKAQGGRSAEEGIDYMEKYDGKFMKARIKPLNGYGQYRGTGSLTIDDTGMTISGKHVYTLGQRWGFGLLLFFGVLILTLGIFAPGVLLIYPIVEYAWLKKEDIRVNFGQIRKVAVNPKKQHVAIEFEGNKYTTPVVLMTPKWQEIQSLLEAKKPPALPQ